jgi:capsular polysaccharide biosynthesis protein
MTDHFKVRSKVYATVAIRWALIVGLVFSAVMASGVYITNHVLARIYSATAVLQVQTQSASAEAYSGWTFSSPQSRAIQAELESIESPEIMHAVINSLALDRVWAERIFDRSDPLSSSEAVHYLESHLRLNFKHDAKVVEVTALSDDPNEAAEIANEVADFYKVSRAALPAGTVKITSLAEVRLETSTPNRRFCYAITAGIAGMLAVMIASSVEICLLIARAEAASGDLQPPR